LFNIVHNLANPLSIVRYADEKLLFVDACKGVSDIRILEEAQFFYLDSIPSMNIDNK